MTQLIKFILQSATYCTNNRYSNILLLYMYTDDSFICMGTHFLDLGKIVYSWIFDFIVSTKSAYKPIDNWHFVENLNSWFTNTHEILENWYPTNINESTVLYKSFALSNKKKHWKNHCITYAYTMFTSLSNTLLCIHIFIEDRYFLWIPNIIHPIMFEAWISIQIQWPYFNWRRGIKIYNTVVKT